MSVTPPRRPAPPAPYAPLKRVKFADLKELAAAAADAPRPPPKPYLLDPVSAIVISYLPTNRKLVIPPIMIPTDEPPAETVRNVPMAPRAAKLSEEADTAQEEPKRPKEVLTKKDIGLMQCTAWLESMKHQPHSTAVREMRKRGDAILPLFYAENSSHMTLVSALSNEQMRLRSIPERSTNEEIMLHSISSNISYLTHSLHSNWKRVDQFHAVCFAIDRS